MVVEILTLYIILTLYRVYLHSDTWPLTSHVPWMANETIEYANETREMVENIENEYARKSGKIWKKPQKTGLIL
jgi:hypothetical protein